MTKQAERTGRGRARLDLSALDGSLSALTAGATSQASASEVGSPATVALDLIDEDPSQPRTNFNTAALQELAESIREVGLQLPVLVQPRPDGRFLLLQGGRRFRACKMLGLTSIKALFAESKDRYAQMVENIQREDLTPMEIARFVAGETSRGVKQAEIATKLGKSKVWVSKYATLGRAPEFVASAAEAGKLPSVDGIYELVTHLEETPSDREQIESALRTADTLTRVEIARLLGSLKVAAAEERATPPMAKRDSEVITAQLSTPGRSKQPDPSETEGSTGTEHPGVRKHAADLPGQSTSGEADEAEESEAAGDAGEPRTLQNRSSSRTQTRETNVPREKTSGAGGRKGRLMASFGSRRVEIDLTRLPEGAKFYVRFVDGSGGEAVANGDALSDLTVTDA